MATPFKENILLLNHRHRGKLRSVLNVIVQRVNRRRDNGGPGQTSR